MICESCHQNLATVHLTEIVQKTKKETHLCEECAREKGVTYSAQFSVKDFLGGLGKKSEKPEPKPAAKLAVQAEPTKPCPSCGITFAEFRQTGRLGCHRDYEHFEELVPLLKKIHNTEQVQHTGRVPGRIGERLELEKQVNDLKAELEKAVALEDYEQAAQLRDAIQSLQQAGRA